MVYSEVESGGVWKPKEIGAKFEEILKSRKTLMKSSRKTLMGHSAKVSGQAHPKVAKKSAA